MRQIQVYLHKEYIDYLQHFGNLDDVVQMALQKVTADDFTDMDEAPPRDDTLKRTLWINCPWYETLLEETCHQRTYSLRKLLYWLVDNEKPVEWGWSVRPCYSYSTLVDYINHCRKATQYMTHIASRAHGAEAQEALRLIDEIDTFKEGLQHIADGGNNNGQ